MSLGAVLTAIVTPFDDRLRVDEEAFVTLFHHVIEHGSDGVVVSATTGESSTLSDTEHLRLIELACTERPAGVTVVASTGSNNTEHGCLLTERATELGADAILSVTPYYNRPNRRGVIRHYQETAKATDKPVVLYNIPSRTSLDLPNELLAELAQIERIDYVKQANDANLGPVDGLGVYAGNDHVFARTLDFGGCGGILVASHVVGPQLKRMVTEPENRAAINAELAPLFAALGVTTNPIPIKAALNLLGHRVGGCRLPLVEADDRETETVAKELRALNLLPANESTVTHG
jgi:4-hydroxy-tetrahydrodipicolinate synthase